MSYAQISDLTLFGMPATALGNTTSAQQQACLDAASAEMDSYFRARYVGGVAGSLPFDSWGTDVTEICVQIAWFKLMRVRGYNPASMDKNIKDAYDNAKKWLTDVKQNKLHPFVIQPQTKLADTPQVFSNKPRGF